MSAVLNHDLKRGLHIIAGDRWNVLSALMLHANIRNRCWPGMRSIATMATNGNPNRANAAKQWLLQHSAIELVPHGKRMDEEKELAPRQHVYQLTGKFTTCQDTECCKDAGQVYYYLYFQTPEVMADDNIEKSNVTTIHNINGDNRSNSNRSKKERTPEKQTPKEPIPMPAAKGKELYDAFHDVIEQSQGENDKQPIETFHYKNIEVARRLDAKGYTVEDVTNTTRFKLQGRTTEYKFMFLEQDIPLYKKNQPTILNTDAYKEFVPPPIPVITDEERERALKVQAESRAERAKESAA